MEGLPQFKRAKKELMEICLNLSKKMTIVQIKEKAALIQTIGTEEFWQTSDILNFEQVRLALRDLIGKDLNGKPRTYPSKLGGSYGFR